MGILTRPGRRMLAASGLKLREKRPVHDRTAQLCQKLDIQLLRKRYLTT